MEKPLWLWVRSWWWSIKDRSSSVRKQPDSMAEEKSSRLSLGIKGSICLKQETAPFRMAVALAKVSGAEGMLLSLKSCPFRFMVKGVILLSRASNALQYSSPKMLLGAVRSFGRSLIKGRCFAAAFYFAAG